MFLLCLGNIFTTVSAL